MDATYNLSGGFKPTVKRFADLDGPDFFPTPAWATYALIDNEKFKGDIWECACGDGAMSVSEIKRVEELFRLLLTQLRQRFLHRKRRAGILGHGVSLNLRLHAIDCINVGGRVGGGIGDRRPTGQSRSLF